MYVCIYIYLEVRIFTCSSRVWSSSWFRSRKHWIWSRAALDANSETPPTHCWFPCALEHVHPCQDTDWSFLQGILLYWVYPVGWNDRETGNGFFMILQDSSCFSSISFDFILQYCIGLFWRMKPELHMPCLHVLAADDRNDGYSPEFGTQRHNSGGFG